VFMVHLEKNGIRSGLINRTARSPDIVPLSFTRPMYHHLTDENNDNRATLTLL
jgi:hypothetical protein